MNINNRRHKFSIIVEKMPTSGGYVASTSGFKHVIIRQGETAEAAIYEAKQAVFAHLKQYGKAAFRGKTRPLTQTVESDVQESEVVAIS